MRRDHYLAAFLRGNRVEALAIVLMLFFSLPVVAQVIVSDKQELRVEIGKMTASPMPEWHLPELSRKRIDDRLSLWVLPDRSLPVVELMLQIPRGDFSDPAETVGRADFMASAWRQGGTLKHAPDAFSALLEGRSIDLNVSVNGEYTLIRLACLKADLPAALDLFQEWFFTPAFDASRTQWVVRQMGKRLLDVKDYPGHLASYLYPGYVYGRESLWGRHVSAADLSHLTREVAVQAHQQWLASGPMLLGVAGDVDEPELEKFARTFARSLVVHAPQVLPRPELKLMPQKQWEAGAHLVVKPGDQSTILMGHLGERRTNPDRFALILANYILGGDPLGSLLALDIRTSRGLVYDIGSSFGFESDYGLFRVDAKTRASETVAVLSRVKAVISDLIAGKGLTQERLVRAKRALIGNLLFANEKKGDLLTTLMKFNFYGYPDDYLEHYGHYIESVSLQDVQAAAARYLSPEKMTILVVGPKEVRGALTHWHLESVVSAADSLLK